MIIQLWWNENWQNKAIRLNRINAYGAVFIVCTKTAIVSRIGLALLFHY
jgi:hypothetical protein